MAIFSLWLSNDTIPNYSESKINRSIASDCHSTATDMILGKNSQLTDSLLPNDYQTLKRNHSHVWNKILGIKEFETFDDREYFLWLQVYRDKNSNGKNINTVTIEQKMALIEIQSEIMLKSQIGQTAFRSDVLKLNPMKLAILNRHIKKLDLSSPLSRLTLNEFASDLAIILKGPPATLADYFTKNKTQRMNERLTRMLYEDLLSYGLRGMVERVPESSNLKNLDRARLLSKKFFKHKIWKLFIFPFDLPWFEKIQIPDELLEKILLDGIDKHNDELISYLKTQDNIDHYERFRRLYKPVAISAAVYFYYLSQTPERQAELKLEKEEERKKLIQEFNNMTDAIMDTKSDVMKPVEEIKHDIREAQLQRVLKAFREEYKEEPSAEEYQEMRKRIFENQ